MTIAEIINMPKGAPITSVDLTIDRVYPQETKQGQNGSYTTQNLQASDSNGDKIRVQLRGCPAVDEARIKGKTIRLESTTGPRGFGGVINDPFEKQDGSVIYSIRVNSSAKRTMLGGIGAPAPAPAQHQPAARQQAAPVPARQAAPSAPALSPGMTVDALGTLYKMALEKAVKTVSTVNPEGCDSMWTTEDVRTIASCIFMEATRNTNWKDLAVKPAPAPAPAIPPRQEDPVDEGDGFEALEGDDVPF